MARRRPVAANVGGLRERLAARDRARAADYSERIGGLREPLRPWLAEALDDGKPVELAGWELSAHVPGIIRAGDGPFVLEPDGSLTAVNIW